MARENKERVAANAIRASGSRARPLRRPTRQSRDSPASRKGPAWSATAHLAGGCARLCLARREAATRHPLPPPPSAIGRPARGRVSESAAIWQRPSGKASPSIGGAPAPRGRGPGGRAQLLFSMGRGAAQLCYAARRCKGPAGWRGNRALLFKKKWGETAEI